QPAETPSILAFGFEEAAAGDQGLVRAPSGKFIAKEIHAEKDDGDFTIAWQVKGDFKKPIVLRGKDRAFKVDAPDQLQEAGRTGSKSLPPQGTVDPATRPCF